MNKIELIRFRELVKKEMENRKKVEEILQQDNNYSILQDYLVSSENRNPEALENIVRKILLNFVVKQSNNIYVCTYAAGESDSTGAWYIQRPSEAGADLKYFTDIETLETVVARTRKPYPSIYKFQKENIVLNPFDIEMESDISENKGLEVVRLDFFSQCYKKSVEETVKTLTRKYPRL